MKIGTALDWTTSRVCSDVPEAMFVRAQAASNYKENKSVNEWTWKMNVNMNYILFLSVA